MRSLHVVAVVVGVAIASYAYGQPAPQRIRGEVVAVHGKDLDVRTSAGQIVTVRMMDSLRVSARSAAGPDALTQGAFIGTTAVEQPDGTLKASEVHVFPESMRGAGEGHRPMETEPGSTMTNATVSSVTSSPKPAPRSTMTNATVAGVASGAAARTLTLRYSGGEKKVVVNEGVPIVLVDAGDSALLVPGAHVAVTAAKQLDGSLTTDRITVGRNGLVP